MKRRKFLSLLLALACTLALVPTAFADKSTTTNGSASVDQNARTEIYVVTQNPGSDYAYYGAKNEPNGGVYFGRFAEEGVVSGTQRGAVNSAALANESIVAFYLELNDSYGLEHWSYIFGSVVADGKHVLLINLNFPGETDDLGPIANGSYDSSLRSNFQYLNTLSCPVLVRIGGEMNCWDNLPSASDYITAFRHIADILHTNAPRAAAVFSPNFSGANKVDMDSFYPGDDYADWIGCSLYFHYAVDGYQNDKFRGSGPVYGDPMLNVQQCANLAAMHKKPLIITEGGCGLTYKGDHSSFASERLDKAMSFLPMVYPQIKGIVFSNYVKEDDYDFSKNPTANAGYQHGVGNNPTLLHSVGDTPSYYTKASSYGGAWEGTMRFAAYTWSTEKLTATWSVDGQDKATVGDYPYAFSLDTSTLSAGKHTIKVTFSNGQTKSQEFTSGSAAPAGTPSTPAASTPSNGAYNANPTGDKLYVDGVLQNPTVYKIDGSNYFKLRDVAMMLNGSLRQFEVGFDAALGAVQVSTERPYTPDGSELAGQASGGKNATISSNTIYVNGVQAGGLTVYTIDGNNYFKLRDLGQVLNFYVGWDAATSSVTISGNADYQ